MMYKYIVKFHLLPLIAHDADLLLAIDKIYKIYNWTNEEIHNLKLIRFKISLRKITRKYKSKKTSYKI